MKIIFLGESYSDVDRANRLSVPPQRKIRSRSGGSANIDLSKLNKTSRKKRAHSYSNVKRKTSAQPRKIVVARNEPRKREDVKKAMKDLLDRHYNGRRESLMFFL